MGQHGRQCCSGSRRRMYLRPPGSRLDHDPDAQAHGAHGDDQARHRSSWGFLGLAEVRASLRVPPGGTAACGRHVRQPSEHLESSAQYCLRKGIVTTAVGFALLIGLSFIGIRGDGVFVPGPWLLGGLIPMFVGLAQIANAILAGAQFPRSGVTIGPIPPPPPGSPPPPPSAPTPIGRAIPKSCRAPNRPARNNLGLGLGDPAFDEGALRSVLCQHQRQRWTRAPPSGVPSAKENPRAQHARDDNSRAAQGRCHRECVAPLPRPVRS